MTWIPSASPPCSSKLALTHPAELGNFIPGSINLVVLHLFTTSSSTSTASSHCHLSPLPNPLFEPNLLRDLVCSICQNPQASQNSFFFLIYRFVCLIKIMLKKENLENKMCIYTHTDPKIQILVHIDPGACPISLFLFPFFVKSFFVHWYRNLSACLSGNSLFKKKKVNWQNDNR